MPPQNQNTSILKVRTFADDLKRAQGTPVAERVVEPPPPSQPAVVSPAPSMRPNSPAATPEKSAVPLTRIVQRSPAPATTTHHDAAFDIRHESTTDASISDATIIHDRQVHEWSALNEIVAGIQTWWNSQILPLFQKKDPHVLTPGVAPQIEETVFTPKAEPLTPVPQTRTLAQDVAAVEAGDRPILPSLPPTSWRRVSEPRTDTPLQHATSEEVREHRKEMQAALPPKPPTPKPSFKAPRPSRPLPAFRTENVISKNSENAVAPATDPRERLKRLAQEDAPPASERIMRDIPFIPPTFTHQASAPIRTYRYDALSDIKNRDLSKPQIAAAEMTQRRSPAQTLPPRGNDEPSRLIPVLGLLSVLLMLGIGGTYAYQLWQAREPVSYVEGTPSFFVADRQTPLTLGEDRTALLEMLNTERLAIPLSRDEAVHFALKKGVGESAQNATTEDVFTVLDFRIPGAFTRTLNSIVMVGAIGESRAPFIVMKTSDFQTAFAGMLAWEEYMSVDLAPFFGGPVRRSYDARALTNDHTREAYFDDVIIQNKDVRILYDEYGTERILYSFINPDTVVVTTSSEALQTLMQEL